MISFTRTEEESSVNVAKRTTDPGLKVIKCLSDTDAEDGVRPTALLIHVGGCHCARFVAL